LGLRGKTLIGDWRGLHNEPGNLHISPGASNEERDGHVLRRTEMHIGVLYEKLIKDDQLEDLVTDKIILKTIFILIRCGS
jgi:hypothetical protein